MGSVEVWERCLSGSAEPSEAATASRRAADRARSARIRSSPEKTLMTRLYRILPLPSTQSGVLQPVVVRRIGEGYQLVVGERRWRAAKLAGLERVPAIIREVDRRREPRAGPRREPPARGSQPDGGSGGLSAAARRVRVDPGGAGPAVRRDRSSIANCLRLLKLPELIQADLRRGPAHDGHARALLSLPPPPSSSGCARRSSRIRGRCARPRKACRRSGAQPPRRSSAGGRPSWSRSRSRCAGPGHARAPDGQRARGRIEIAYTSREELDGSSRPASRRCRPAGPTSECGIAQMIASGSWSA